MDELLSMIDELKSKGISIDELQLQKYIEVYRYLEKVAKDFGGIVKPTKYSYEGCGVEFKCDYFDTLEREVFSDLLSCCSELEIDSEKGAVFSMRFLVPGVFIKEVRA